MNVLFVKTPSEAAALIELMFGSSNYFFSSFPQKYLTRPDTSDSGVDTGETDASSCSTEKFIDRLQESTIQTVLATQVNDALQSHFIKFSEFSFCDIMFRVSQVGRSGVDRASSSDALGPGFEPWPLRFKKYHHLFSGHKYGSSGC